MWGFFTSHLYGIPAVLGVCALTWSYALHKLDGSSSWFDELDEFFFPFLILVFCPWINIAGCLLLWWVVAYEQIEYLKSKAVVDQYKQSKE